MFAREEDEEDVDQRLMAQQLEQREFPSEERAKKKVVAVDSAPKEKKAEVSGSDFLDVVWGAETSARPTLNIAEMMMAFQVQSKDADEASTASTIEDEEEG